MFNSDKDYKIHSEWADAERDRRWKRISGSEKSSLCTGTWFHCTKCDKYYHGVEILFCDCLYDWKQFHEDLKNRKDYR